ncbi:MAG: hypothetical protein ABIU97_02100 [Dehalococcoidia bacterium]
MGAAEVIAAIRVVHVITAILLVWPFYALVAVNQRARLGPPLGDRADTYLENMVKNRTIPCFVFQATVLLTGLILVWDDGGLGRLVSQPALGIKFLLLLTIGGLLTYVHLRLQPKIDALFASGGGNTLTSETAQAVVRLRLRRKRLAAVCLLAVLLAAMLGVQAAHPFPLWLTLVFVAALAVFVWRAYTSVTPYGWM